MIRWRHRFALWLGPRLMARGLKVRGIDPGDIVAAADRYRRASRG